MDYSCFWSNRHVHKIDTYTQRKIITFLYDERNILIRLDVLDEMLVNVLKGEN